MPSNEGTRIRTSIKTELRLGCVLLATTACLAADEIRVYVAPDGRDTWSGQLVTPNADQTDGPFATVQRAQAALRKLRADGVPQPAWPKPEVLIRGGWYTLEAPLVFTPEDSHTIYRAYSSERPVLSGGARIEGWTVGADGRWRVRLDAVREGEWYFTQLFVNDQRRFRPRLPASGYYHIAGEVEATPEAKGRGIDQFVFSDEEIRADWANLNEVEVLAFHSWSMSRLPIRSVDRDQRTVNFFGTSPGRSAWGIFRKGNRYLVENVKEALDAPGEWYLDRSTGELTYVPRPGETPLNTTVIAPRLDHLVVFEGDLEPSRFVEDIQFEGLTFAHSRWATPRTGQAIAQAEINLDGAITAIGARGMVFERCAVRHVGTYALAFGEGCRDNRVEACELVDLGAGGVKIGATGLEDWGGLARMAKSPEPLVSHHIVRDCTIAHGGRLHPAAIGVWIGHSPHNRIEHNEIFDLYYSATSIGWIWGYRPSHAHHNQIVYNHLHTLGQGVLSDMGAVYTLGISPGTVVNYNVIHDVHAFDYGGWGLYTDEGSTGVTMANNLVYRTKTGGFHQHYGRENRIVNNIFAFTRNDQLQRTRVEDHLSFTFERNIVLYDRGTLMNKPWGDRNLQMDRNLYWNTAGPVVFPENRNLAQWQDTTGRDRHSAVADPGFVDAAKDDFRLRPDSPAVGIGFVPFDYSKAGRLTTRVLTAGLPEVPPAFD